LKTWNRDKFLNKKILLHIFLVMLEIFYSGKSNAEWHFQIKTFPTLFFGGHVNG